MRAPKPRDHRLRLAMHPAGVDEPQAENGAGQLTAEKNVRGDVAHAGEREVLIDHLDAGLANAARLLADDGDAVEADLASVGTIDAGDRLHQRRFACAVVADERHRAACVDREADAAQSFDGAERFADILEFKKAHRRQPSLLLMRSSQTARISTAPIAIC